MRLHAIIAILSAGAIAAGCTQNSRTSSVPTGPSAGGDTTGGSSSSGDWLIPLGEVHDGGPGKDGIPSLDATRFVSASEHEYLEDHDLVIAVKVGDDIRAYPHEVLDWHEIVNDEFAGLTYSVTYCPLTGSGIVWDRHVSGQTTEFGVSGLLYNTNLIPYDRATDSYWSQMTGMCVGGANKGTRAVTHPAVEMTWGTLRARYPDVRALSYETGVYRAGFYTNYPYRDYRTNHNYLIFGVSPDDRRLPRKERVLGVRIGGESRVYRFGSFPDAVAINDFVGGVAIVVYGSEPDGLIVAYERRRTDSGDIQAFGAVTRDSPGVVMRDNSGVGYDIFGTALDGARVGERLVMPDSYMSYWFAWAAFNPGAAIHGIDAGQ